MNPLARTLYFQPLHSRWSHSDHVSKVLLAGPLWWPGSKYWTHKARKGECWVAPNAMARWGRYFGCIKRCRSYLGPGSVNAIWERSASLQFQDWQWEWNFTKYRQAMPSILPFILKNWSHRAYKTLSFTTQTPPGNLQSMRTATVEKEERVQRIENGKEFYMAEQYKFKESKEGHLMPRCL